MDLRSIPRSIRLGFPAFLLAGILLTAQPGHAASKEIIELQTQVQQLLDQMQRLQSTIDSRFGVVQHLVEQSTDSVNQMNATVTAMQVKLNAQSEATSGKLDSVSGQVQSLNDSLDELKSRIAKLDKQMQDIQSQMQNVQSQPAPAGGQGAGGGGFAGSQSVPPQAAAATQPDQSAPPSGMGAASGPVGAQAPPLQETYQSGLRDYNSAHYDTASAEFGDVLHYYPQDDLAGNAQFYLGEIAYRQQKFKDAIKAYNAVLENFGGSPKAPAAQLRKGTALIQLNQKRGGDS